MASKGIFEQLTTDHREVDDLMNRIEKAQGEEECMRLFAQVRTALLAHSQAEDEVLYARLEEEEDTEELIAHAREEHQQVEDLLEELGEIEDDDVWMERFEELKGAVQDHVKEEERELFPKARKLLDREVQLQLATQFEDIKQDELEGLAADEGGMGEIGDEEEMATTSRIAGEGHAGGKRPGAASLDSYTKKELVERARDRGVEGYSHMTKAQLIDALRR